jgi:hypothetical protein
MSQPPESAPTLRELQREFARALRPQPGTSPVPGHISAPSARALASGLEIYRNNARQFFRSALELTYPVVRRRVGDEYFRQLAERYREAHPSRHGDLHWIGARFPQWLTDHLRESAYAWLGELARLEWLCEESAASRRDPALRLECLAEVPAAQLDDLRLELQPSLRLLASEFPVWSVWQANQGHGEAAPVDLARGPEHVAITCLDERVTVYRLQADHFRLLHALAAGAALGNALDAARVDAPVLTALLGWAFDEQLVVALSPSVRA